VQNVSNDRPTRLARLAAKPSLRLHHRLAAIERLTDPELLVQLATEGDEERVQEAALHKLTDQVHLERVALHAKPGISGLAIDRLTDPRRVYEIERSVPKMAHWARHRRVLMSDDEAVLRLGDPKLDEPARDLLGAALHVKLALHSRVVERRLPGLHLDFQQTVGGADYLSRGLPGGSAHVSTLGATFRIERGDHAVAVKSWEISPPSDVALTRDRVNRRTNITQQADVRAEELLAELLDAAPFTDGELGELVASEVAELRLAAISRLRAPQRLASIATDDPSVTTRLAAIVRLNDRALLARLAAQDKDLQVRTVAERRLENISAAKR